MSDTYTPQPPEGAIDPALWEWIMNSGGGVDPVNLPRDFVDDQGAWLTDMGKGSNMGTDLDFLIQNNIPNPSAYGAQEVRDYDIPDSPGRRQLDAWMAGNDPYKWFVANAIKQGQSTPEIVRELQARVANPQEGDPDFAAYLPRQILRDRDGLESQTEEYDFAAIRNQIGDLESAQLSDPANIQYEEDGRGYTSTMEDSALGEALAAAGYTSTPGQTYDPYDFAPEGRTREFDQGILGSEQEAMQAYLMAQQETKDAASPLQDAGGSWGSGLSNPQQDLEAAQGRLGQENPFLNYGEDTTSPAYDEGPWSGGGSQEVRQGGSAPFIPGGDPASNYTPAGVVSEMGEETRDTLFSSDFWKSIVPSGYDPSSMVGALNPLGGGADLSNINPLKNFIPTALGGAGFNPSRMFGGSRQTPEGRQGDSLRQGLGDNEDAQRGAGKIREAMLQGIVNNKQGVVDDRRRRSHQAGVDERIASLASRHAEARANAARDGAAMRQSMVEQMMNQGRSPFDDERNARNRRVYGY